MRLELPHETFKGYIFDCDGTLTDNMPLHYKAWSQTMQDFGGQFSEELFYLWGGKPTLVIAQQLNEKYGLSMNPQEVVQRKEQYYLEMIPKVQPFKPVTDYVHRFYGKAKLAVASGGYRHLVVKTLKTLNLFSYFDVIVTAEDYKYGKPAPDPFLLVAKLIGVSPSECLVFEDSPTGIKAAEAAGMHHIFVPTAQAALARLREQQSRSIASETS